MHWAFLRVGLFNLLLSLEHAFNILLAFPGESMCIYFPFVEQLWYPE